MPESIPGRPKKLQRISQACDLCHRRSIRCRPSAELPSKCQNCYDFAVECTYNRPSRRRRNPSVSLSSRPNITGSQPDSQISSFSESAVPATSRYGLSPATSDARTSRPANANLQDLRSYTPSLHSQGDFVALVESDPRDRKVDALGTAWRSVATTNRGAIDRYLAVFTELIYPTWPVFHLSTLGESIRRGSYLGDDGLFASVMAACAYAASHESQRSVGGFIETESITQPSSEVFFTAAQDVVLRQLPESRDAGSLRACLLVALTAIQYGQIPTMHLYIGHYFTMSARLRFHDEAYWPGELTPVEIWERRCIFWSMYKLDVYTSIVYNGILRSQELMSNVRYPREIDDEYSAQSQGAERSHLSWMTGWTATLDLYRILEHVTHKARWHSYSFPDRASVVQMVIGDSFSTRQVLDNIFTLCSKLPTRFREFDVRFTRDREQDIYGFQAVNIQVVLSLVHTILWSIDPAHDPVELCGAAEQTSATLRSIAPDFLRFVGASQFYPLERFGQMLASLTGAINHEALFTRVRAVLAAMIELVSSLESGMHIDPSSSQSLQRHLAQLDRGWGIRVSRGSRPLVLPAVPTVLSSSHLVPPHLSSNPDINVPAEGYHLTNEYANDENWPWPFSATHDSMT